MQYFKLNYIVWLLLEIFEVKRYQKICVWKPAKSKWTHYTITKLSAVKLTKGVYWTHQVFSLSKGPSPSKKKKKKE